MSIKLVILDRDGVINEENAHGVYSVADFVPIKDSIQAIAKLTQNGYTVAIATNQACIGRKKLTLAGLAEIHEHLQNLLKPLASRITKICFCPHLSEDQCQCRKPKPAMLKEILHYFNLAPQKSVFFVGDSLRDLQAAQAIGIAPILVLTGHGRETRTNNAELCATIPIFSSLAAFVKDMIN